MKKLFILALILCFTLPIIGQAQDPATQEKAEDPQQTAEKAPIKTWAIPAYHRAHLDRLVEEFNKLWESELDKIKIELQQNYRGFETMPIQDVVFDRIKGYFIHREDFLTLQKEAAALAPIKKEIEKK